MLLVKSKKELKGWVPWFAWFAFLLGDGFLGLLSSYLYNAGSGVF